MEQHAQAAKKKKTVWYNLAFVLVCGGLFLFLWRAPEETTAKIPLDEDHKKFHAMGKKDAEKFCAECHSAEAGMPLSPDHPPKYRCLFCHKRQ